MPKGWRRCLVASCKTIAILTAALLAFAAPDLRVKNALVELNGLNVKGLREQLAQAHDAFRPANQAVTAQMRRV